MSANKEKFAKILLTTAGIGIGVYLITRYHKNIYNKLTKAKNLIIYDLAKIQRTSFDVHIINDIGECSNIVQRLRE
jgi:hypothetical protein